MAAQRQARTHGKAASKIATAPVIDEQLAELMDSLTGFLPAVDRVIAAFAELLTTDLTSDQSMSAVAALGALDGGNLATLLGLSLRRIADPDANAALAGLPADRKQQLRRLGAEYAAAIDDRYQQQIAAEVCAVIDPDQT